jgi:hypothetical protein
VTSGSVPESVETRARICDYLSHHCGAFGFYLFYVDDIKAQIPESKRYSVYWEDMFIGAYQITAFAVYPTWDTKCSCGSFLR